MCTIHISHIMFLVGLAVHMTIEYFTTARCFKTLTKFFSHWLYLLLGDSAYECHPFLVITCKVCTRMVGFCCRKQHMLHTTTKAHVTQHNNTSCGANSNLCKKIEVGSDLILILGGGLSVMKNPHDSSLHQQNGRLSDQKI